MNAIQITIPLIFCFIAVAMTFFRRLPACLVAYIAYVLAGVMGVFKIPVEQYLIWGIIAVADTVNIYATRMEPPRSMQLYAVVGCLVGCLVGGVSLTMASIMIGGAIGAAVGFLAYTRTPQGMAMKVPMTHKLSMLAGSACTAWFSYVLVFIVLFRILYPNS